MTYQDILVCILASSDPTSRYVYALAVRRRCDRYSLYACFYIQVRTCMGPHISAMLNGCNDYEQLIQPPCILTAATSPLGLQPADKFRQRGTKPGEMDPQLVGIWILERFACAETALHDSASWSRAGRMAVSHYGHDRLYHAISFSFCQNLPVFPAMSPSASRTGVFAPSSTVFTPPPLVMSVLT